MNYGELLLCILFLGIAKFLYPWYKLFLEKVVTKKNQQQSTGSSTPTPPSKKGSSPWMLLLPLAIPLFFVGALWLIYISIVEPFVKRGSSLSLGTIPPWVLYVLIIGIIAWVIWYFWEHISAHASTLTKKAKALLAKKNAATTPTTPAKKNKETNWYKVVAIVILLWIVLPRLLPYVHVYSPSSTSTPSGLSATRASSFEKFKLSGTNDMKQGKYFVFSIGWDDPDISFEPIGVPASDTTELFFYKGEDRTRQWTLYIWKEHGKKKGRFSPRQPLPTSLLGTVYVCSVNRDAIVAVTQKEK